MPVRRAAPFFVVSVREGRGGVPWDTVSRMAGGCADKFLFPPGVEPPEDAAVRRFVPALYPRRLLVNTAVRVLELSRVPPGGISLCLIDPAASVVSALPVLARLCKTAVVVTRRPAPCGFAAAQVLERLGAAVLVTDSLDASRGSNVVIDCSGGSEARGEGAVFSLRARDGAICGGSFTLPEYYERLLPCELDRFDFAAALCELCAAGELGTLCFDDVLSDGKVLSLHAAAALVDRLLV